MRYIKKTIWILIGFLFCLILIYGLIPKGYLFLDLLNKKGIQIYAERVEEDFLGFRLYNVILNVSSLLKNLNKLGKLSLFFKNSSPELKFSEVIFSKNELFIPCKANGFIKVFYYPPKKIIIEIKNFTGECVQRKEFKKVSGNLVYLYPRNIKGELRIEGLSLFPGFSRVFMYFKGRRVIIRSSNFEQTLSF